MTRAIKDGDVFLINGLEYRVSYNSYCGGLELLPNVNCYRKDCLECSYYPGKCFKKLFNSSDEMLNYLKEMKHGLNQKGGKGK